MSVFVLKYFNGYSFGCMHNARGMHLICCIIKTISNLNLLHNSSSTNVSICLCCQLESFVFSIQCFTFSYYHLLLSFLTIWLHSFLPISFHYSNELMVCLNAVLMLINVYPTRIVSKTYRSEFHISLIIPITCSKYLKH